MIQSTFDERVDTYCLNDPHLRGASWSALALKPDRKGEMHSATHLI